MSATELLVVITRAEDGWLAGEVRVAGRATQPFVGWVGLLSALETAISGGSGRTTPKGDT